MEKLAAKVAGHADAGDQAVGRALEAALAAQRFFDAAAEKQREVVKYLTDASAAFSAVRAAAVPPEDAERGPGPAARPKSPAPPPSKSDPNRPGPEAAGGIRSGAMLAALAVGLGGLSAGPLSPPEARAMDGRELFVHGHYAEAAEVFRDRGDKHRSAESLIAAGRHDLAVGELVDLSDGRSDYLRGLAAEARGDPSAALALWQLARDKGDDLAPLKLRQLGKG